MYAVLESIRDALAAVEGVKTCCIGMEAGITPADYPLVRIVPSKVRDGVPRGPAQSCDALIYFGQAIHEFEGGLEALYEQQFAFGKQLLSAARAATRAGEVVFEEMILDEDRLEAFKMFALRVRIVG